MHDRSERKIEVVRTSEGVELRILEGDRAVTEPVILPPSEASKLGKILIMEARAFSLERVALAQKIASIESEVVRLSKAVSQLSSQVEALSKSIGELSKNLEEVRGRVEKKESKKRQRSPS